jgi:hypothetical protein
MEWWKGKSIAFRLQSEVGDLQLLEWFRDTSMWQEGYYMVFYNDQFYQVNITILCLTVMTIHENKLNTESQFNMREV